MKIISTTRLSIKVAIWATLGLLGLSTTLGVQQLSATASQTPVITSVTSDASQQITVNWTPPTDLDFTGYIVRYRMSTATDWEEASLPSTSATSYIVNGLTNSTAYQVQLGAVYNAELVVSAISNDVVPYGLPNAPVMTELVSEASGELTVRWTAPSSDGGSVVTEYKATTGVEAESCTVSSSATECTIANLVNGTSYSVTVAAKNARGYGATSSSLSTTPYGVAGAPTGVSGVAGNQQVVVSWTAPTSNNGSVVTGYVVTGSPSGGSCSATGLTCTVTGLTNGTSYTFSVKAANARGDSVASASSTAVIPVTTPSAPTSLVATAGDAAATITFAAPSSTGGASITNYKYSTDGVNWKLLSPVQAASPVTISEQSNSTARLVNGTVYQIKLRAVNSAGDGLESDAVSVTPVFSATTPGAPTNVVAIAGNASASIEFTAPSSTGGADITNYKYSTDGGISFTALVPASTSTPIVITGLVNGTTYQVKLRAVNSVGDGTASSTVSVTPTVGVVLAVPGAPTNVVATTGNASASVAFTAPSSTGGAPILEYIVRAVPTTSGQTKTCSTTTTLRCELTGLTNNVEYTVVVVARNSVGESANSNSISIFPVAPPSVQVLQSLPESLALPNNSPAPGESIVLTFSGFTPFEWVVITLQSTPTVLNSLQADSSGVITTSVVLPSSTSLGSHTLSLLGLTSGTGARKTITVSSAAQSSFISLSEPKRVVDTRGGGRFGSTSLSKVLVKRVQVFGALTTDGVASGLPSSGIGAVALNVTAVNGFDDGGFGFVTVYPCESDSTVAPNSSNLNFAGGQTIPNAVIAPVSSNGYVCFSVYGNTDLLVDVSGYFGS
jgi:predicted RNA-binding protein with TRAM domain